MKFNLHTHVSRCRHAQGSAQDYLQEAIDKNLELLGFSDHAPFPDVDFGYRMPFSELADYFQDVDVLTQKYSNDIIVKKSLEIEYLPEYLPYYQDLREKYHVDYLLLGEHFYHDRNGTLRNITQAQDTTWYVDYANAAAEGMRSGLFEVIAHPDIFAMNPFAWDDNCEQACAILLEAARSTGTILEFNANGFRREKIACPDGLRHMYPHHRFWELAAGSGAPVLVGSDCHNPTQVWDGAMDLAYRELESLGIAPMVRPGFLLT